jgi:hypothetical protein
LYLLLFLYKNDVLLDRRIEENHRRAHDPCAAAAIVN